MISFLRPVPHPRSFCVLQANPGTLLTSHFSSITLRTRVEGGLQEQKERHTREAALQVFLEDYWGTTYIYVTNLSTLQKVPFSDGDECCVHNAFSMNILHF